MPKNRIIMILGILIALLPVLGFRHSWESVFQVFAGLSIVTLIIWTNIDKRLSLKAKAQKRQEHKMRQADLTAPQETNQTPQPPAGEI